MSDAKRLDSGQAGAAVMRLIKSGPRPRDILTRKAFENAITVVIALSGSTNAVLHLLAIAQEAGVKLRLEDFSRIGRRVPVLADVRPSGRYLMSELIAIGGIQPLMKTLLDADLLHGDCLTVTGRTVAQNLEGTEAYPEGQDIVRPLSQPIKKNSHLVVLKGNVAPEGAVAKITGKEGVTFEGARQGLRRRGICDERDPERHSVRGRCGRDPLRRTPGRSWHARDVEPDRRAHGAWARRQRCADHRRSVLRGQPRICRWTYRTGSGAWRSHRFAAHRRSRDD